MVRGLIFRPYNDCQAIMHRETNAIKAYSAKYPDIYYCLLQKLMFDRRTLAPFDSSEPNQNGVTANKPNKSQNANHAPFPLKITSTHRTINHVFSGKKTFRCPLD